MVRGLTSPCPQHRAHPVAEFVRSSLDLASEYAALGLVDRTLEVLGRARIALFGEDVEEYGGSPLPPSPLGVELLLLSSKMLAEMNEPELRLASYSGAYSSAEPITSSILEYRKASKMCDALDDERVPSTALRIRNRALQLERSALACSVFSTIELCRVRRFTISRDFELIVCLSRTTRTRPLGL